MNIATIPLEPNESYIGEGRMSSFGGASFINSNLQLSTDEVGRVKTFNDGMPPSGVESADMWDYLKLTNVRTGVTWDLRLHTAVLNGLVEMAEQAIADGADVQLRIKQGSTALHWAAAKGQEEIANVLLDHGADVNATDELGWTPAELATKAGHTSLAALLSKRGGKTQATPNRQAPTTIPGLDPDVQLVEAVEADDLNSAKAAIEAGADVNCVSEDGWPPLLSAIKEGAPLVELLLAHGADPNVASDRGYTPLMRAAGLGKVEIVRLLLDAGADRQMRDCDDKTANQLAREVGQLQCAEMVQVRRQTVSVPLDEGERNLIKDCSKALGVPVMEVDVEFDDGHRIDRAEVAIGAILIPQDCSGKTIKWISIPLEQGAQVRTKGYAARSDRPKNGIELGTLMMNWMMQNH